MHEGVRSSKRHFQAGMSEKSIKGRLHSHSNKSEQKENNMAANGSAISASQPAVSTEKKKKPVASLPELKPEDVTVHKIWEVLQTLVTSINDIKEFATPKGMKQSISDINALQQSLATRVNSMEHALTNVITRTNLVGNLLIRAEERSEEIAEEVKVTRRKKARPNLIVRGIIESKDEKKDVTVQKTQSFFKEQLEITEEIPIKHAFRVGRKDQGDRPVLVRLSQIEDKGTIYKSVSNLKGKTNAKRRLFNIDDDLDQQQAEEKRYYRVLKKENLMLDEENRLEIRMAKGHITANNQKVQQSLFPPTSARILTMDEHEMEDVRATKLVKGEEFSESGSDYISYVQKVRSVREVQKGLYKLRIKYADATHISCAYRLESPIGPFNQSYYDDGEYGAGRSILQAIKDRNLNQVAVYIVRYYG